MTPAIWNEFFGKSMCFKFHAESVYIEKDLKRWVTFMEALLVFSHKDLEILDKSVILKLKSICDIPATEVSLEKLIQSTEYNCT